MLLVLGERYRSLLENGIPPEKFACPYFVVFAITPRGMESVDPDGAGYIPWRNEAPALEKH
jgi:hypothetical protein